LIGFGYPRLDKKLGVLNEDALFILDWRLDSNVIEIPATSRFSIRTMAQIWIRQNQKL
jgi:hypothetical protein